uniref:protein shisa-9-like n=1 Tax=Pristiophorus japonicus TaxID=55135 RepID=UPI00398F4637
MEFRLMIGLWGYFVTGQVLIWASAHSGKVDQLDGQSANGTKASPLEVTLGSTEAPLNSDRCRGYYDVMGQWDPPFNCNAGTYLYCCGTCGYRFCCEFQHDRLDQSTCTNYDTPNWANTGTPPVKVDDTIEDPEKDKTNMIVYIICGVVAIMVLVGIFTKLGLEKARGPQTEMNMSRALTDLLKQQGHPTTDYIERDGNVGTVQVPITEGLTPRLARNSTAAQARAGHPDQYGGKRTCVTLKIPRHYFEEEQSCQPSVQERRPVLVRLNSSNFGRGGQKRVRRSKLQGVILIPQKPVIKLVHWLQCHSSLLGGAIDITTAKDEKCTNEGCMSEEQCLQRLKEVVTGLCKLLQTHLAADIGTRTSLSVAATRLLWYQLLPVSCRREQRAAARPGNRRGPGLQAHLRHTTAGSSACCCRRATADCNQPHLNNASVASPSVSQMGLPHPHNNILQRMASAPLQGQEYSKYATLKAVAETVADDFYSKRYPVMDLPPSGTIFPGVAHHQKDRQAGDACGFMAATPGQKTKVSKMNTHPLFNSSYKGWDQSQPMGRRHMYAGRRQYSIEHLPEIFSPPLHYKQPQRHLSTNSKTEVTV